MKLSLPQYLLKQGEKVAGVVGACEVWVSEQARLSFPNMKPHTGVLAKGLDRLKGL